ncbi:MAG: multidrug efflux RND transporter permease subunit [Chthoniobacteraceae bacterium]
MRFSHFFITRPIFAAVLSILIVIVGGLALLRLPIAEYPDVVPPTIVVDAEYPGADARVVAETVATPIEQEVNGVEDMLYLESQCTNDGHMALTVTFKLGTDLDKAQVLVQNRVALASSRLPDEVRRGGVNVVKRSPNLTLVVNLVSPDRTRDQLYLSNYALLQVKDELARVEGVGSVETRIGLREYSMRIWLDPQKMAVRNLTASDVTRALQEQNLQVAAGVIGQAPAPAGTPFVYTVTTQGRLIDEEQFGDIVVLNNGQGAIVRLREVGRVELGSRDYDTISHVDGKPAAAMLVFQQPGANGVATSDAVRAAMNEMRKSFPRGVDYAIVYDTTQFVRESIASVRHTFLEAVALVVLVVIVFLQSWRASIIPLIAVPVSIVGTFAVMSVLGFSLNNLSLFGLVLAIGIVVDDAIVVVENVERNLAAGMAPQAAAFKAMDEVSGALIAVALVLAAVFLPTAFLTGITGEFYRQFALTVAVSTFFSALNSLTLSPALAALLLQPHGAKKDWLTRTIDFLFGWFFRLFNRAFDFLIRTFGAFTARAVRVAWLGAVIYVGLLALTWVGFQSVPVGFIPPQDKGYLVVYCELPDGATIERTDAVVKRITDIALAVPGVAHVLAFTGYSVVTSANSTNLATCFLPLEDFGKREGNEALSAKSIADQIQGRVVGIREAFVGVFPPPPILGLGSLGGFKLLVQDRNDRGLGQLARVAQGLAASASKTPGLSPAAFSTFRTNTPQLRVDIDRAKAKSMGVPLSEVFDTLQVYLGSSYVNDFNRFGRTYRVTVQAESEQRVEPADIGRLKTRNAAGGMVPLAALGAVTDLAGPGSVVRHNLYPSADLNAGPDATTSSGDAIALMEKLAARDLPPGYTIAWTDLTFQEKLAGNAAIYVFPLCVLFVFLVLAAQYESWSLPFAVVLVVPMCLLSAIGGIYFRNYDNNIFTQIAFVVLVGLACKNAILIVEFARQLEDQGRTRFDAAVESARQRLRPILMTSFAFILGVVPLVVATGAGFEMRRSLGTAVFFGMLGVTFFGLLLTPLFYVLIRKFAAVPVPPAEAAK